MGTATESPPDLQTDGPDPPTPTLAAATAAASDHDLLSELEYARESLQQLLSKSAAMEEDLILVQRQRDEAISRVASLNETVDGLSSERDSLRGRIKELEDLAVEREEDSVAKFEEELREREGLRIEIEVYREKFHGLETEREQQKEFLLRIADSTKAVKESLARLIDSLDDEKVAQIEEDESLDTGEELDRELRSVWEEILEVTRLVDTMESKVNDYKDLKKKERKQLENSVVSLTEENRDISSLLRIALVEKESVEKTLNKLRGGNEQKRVPLLQFAERGLQRVGFGFMMGSGNAEQPMESSGASSTGSKSDGSDCEEEVVSLASTVERIMKNLRQEITQLRKSLEDSRSDTERLQSLTNKQAQEIAENTLYIKELEERERLLAQNVEELLNEIKETEEEVARWREACELEVVAGKSEIEERDEVQELEKTKAALDMSNGKLKLKEDLAAAAMAAQEAAERSLQLADSRAAGLRERIEELTRQLEEVDGREKKSRQRVRHICWPWRILKNPFNTANARFPNVRRMLPEMQALLHSSA
ncbi:uncharacterized protein At3g49055 isoform X2 [Rhodamnia argentea]|uniref:Uncharacterized protein At3g49055 isoform X2 n=1 Tax=Rhodamnia argentea TaxID=178133 RepID=A0A8B8PDS8_9MYRT|nr:uncharacterized protein At3g49055 isoform X2 [Rhodamnia argentea]